MSEEGGRVLEVGAVLRATARAMGRNAGPIATFAFGVSLIEVVAGQLVVRGVGTSPDGVVIAGIVSLLLGVLASAFKTAGITHAIRARRKTHLPSLGESAARAFARAPTVALTSLLTMLVVGVGMLMLVIPGIYASLLLMVAAPVATMEQGGPVLALTRSRELAAPHVGTIFLCNLLLSPLLFGGYIVAAVVQSFLSAEPFTASLVRVGAPTDLPTVLLSSFAIAVMSGVTATYAAVLYGMLARKPRKPLGERVARVFE